MVGYIDRELNTLLTLSKRTDYGLIALAHLASRPAGTSVSAREIAGEYAIPVELLAKIMQKLARAGLVTSSSGPSGGYKLSRLPKEISVSSIIEAIDGAPAFTQCMKIAGNDCEQLSHCNIRRPLARIHSRILQMLSLITLEEIGDVNSDVYPVFITMPKSGTLSTNRAALK